MTLFEDYQRYYCPEPGDLICLRRDFFLVPLPTPVPVASNLVMPRMSGSYAGGSGGYGIAPVNTTSSGSVRMPYAVNHNTLIPKDSLVLCLKVTERRGDKLHPFAIQFLWGEQIYECSNTQLYW